MQPNILLIMTDQQRQDSLGCYGADWVDTPNLDALGEEGIIFDQVYVNSPVCTPSRASILTGKPACGHGVYRLHDVLDDAQPLVPWHLQHLGYTTALFGKLHVSGRVAEEQRRHPKDGFSRYQWCMEASVSMDSPFNGYAAWLKREHEDFFWKLKEQGRNLKHIPKEYHFTHWAAEETIGFLRSRPKDKPFFCMMSVFDPHNPYDQYPIEYRTRVREDALPPLVAGKEDETPAIQALRREQIDGYLGPVAKFSQADIQAMRVGYYSSLALLDDEVGRVLRTLEEEQLSDSTMVIFVSDHGDMLGDHHLFVKGAYFYDPCVKVPLIIKHPNGTGGGKRSALLVQPHDLAATILSEAGMDIQQRQILMPDSLDLLDPGCKGHDEAVCIYRQTGIDKTGRYFDPPIHATMLTDGRYKLNVYHGNPVTGQLFDLINDPDECTNLWDACKEVRLELLHKLVEWQVRTEIQTKSGKDALPKEAQLLSNALR
ncbi:MAG: sulfatase [Sphaerochaeta sp.]|jgi:arylsulfatase A-like enzyme|uniref:sulfatase family protein n=1 Tax=Sphaerochaeta sp. TaxID=1972642 RepID=UPI002FC7AF25